MKKYVIEYNGKFYRDYFDLMQDLPDDKKPTLDEDEAWNWEKWFVTNFLKLDVKEQEY